MNETELTFTQESKTQIGNEKIIFLDYSQILDKILLLSSNNILYLCSYNNPIEIIKILENILSNKIKILRAFFSNSNRKKLMLLSNDNNIYEYNIDRRYISHIFYNCFNPSSLFEMNNNYINNNNNNNNNIHNRVNERIKNFGLLNRNNNVLKIYNNLDDNKKNILIIKDVLSFSYDSSGIILYVLIKQLECKKNNKICIFKFIDEYNYKKLFDQLLNFLNDNEQISYLKVFGTKIIISDSSFKKIYILNNYPINKVEFTLKLENSDLNSITTILFPIINNELIDSYKIIVVNSQDSKTQLLISINLQSNTQEKTKIQMEISGGYYYNVNQRLFLVFDNDNKLIINYSI